jgi:hypothetical protein
VLLITEEAVVVDELESVSGFALLTSVWLCNFTSGNELILNELAFVTLEAGFLHFGDDV